MTKHLARAGMAVMTTLLALVVFWQFRMIIIYVLISLMLAATLRPLVNRLAGRKFIVRAAWILLYLVALGSFGSFFFLTGETAMNEIQKFGQTVSVQGEWMLPVWLEGTTFQQALMTRLPPPSTLFEAVTGSQGQLVLPALLGFTQGIGGLVSGALFIFFLSIYWSISQIHFERLWLSLLPSGQRKQARDIWRIIEPDIGSYIRSQIILSLLAGLLLFLGYWLIGSPFPVFLALTGALACLIPVVGVVLAVLIPLLVGLLTSVQLGLYTVLYALGVLIALNVLIKARLFNRKWDNPILTVVLLIALADAFGFVGLIIAPPISVVCQILWNRLVSHRLASGAAAQISDLKERQERLLASINAMDGPALPLVTSSMERLTLLIAKAEPILQSALPEGSSEPLSPIATKPDQGKNNGSTQNS
jgi:putative permease